MPSALLARILGDHRRAAALYFQKGRLERAAQMFERADQPVEAARLWLRSGREPRALAALEEVHPERCAELLSEEDRDDLAIRFFEQARSFWKAAECARRLRRPLRAGRLFEQAGALEQAAVSYKDAGDEQQLLRVLANLSEELGKVGKYDEQQKVDLDRAKRLVEHEEYAGAAVLLERHQRWAPAAQIWQRLGKTEEAISALLQAGNALQAAQLMDVDDAETVTSPLRAKVLQAVSRHREAALAYEDAGDISGAMRQLEAAGAYSEAAARAETRGHFHRAVDLWLSANSPRDAARVIAATGNLSAAAELARQNGDHRSAADYYGQMDDHLRAAQEFLKADRTGQAIDALERVEEGSEDHRSAARLLIPLLVVSGRFEQALRVVAILGVDSDGHGSTYWQGRALEGLERRTAALECFRAIAAQKPRYRDVVQRIQRIEASDSQSAQQSKPAKVFKAGDRLQDRYELEEEIGRGGWGRVFRARDAVRRRPVAVKVMAPRFARLDDAENRLREEVRLCRRLRHPGIVRVLEYGKVEGVLFVVMELVEGPTVESHLERHGAMTEVQVGDLAEAVASALTVAHREEIVHRDLGTANIIMLTDGAKIMDFGIAVSVDGALSVDSDGNVLGTPHFMSPEQIRGLPLDGRSDLYSLGVVLYWCLAGEPPFDGGSVTAISLKHMQDEAKDLRELRPDVSTSLIEIVKTLLAKEPEQRFRDASGLLAALRTWRERTLT